MSLVNLGTYAAVSSALAGITVAKAFHDYPNFYAATIHLSQNYTASLVMGNFLLLAVFGITHVLQRFIYGPLRLIESEGVQNKLWIAVTEIALAMATFRDEFEASVLLMFSSLLAGKVWSWIAAFRLEYFEQLTFSQPTSENFRFLGGLSVLVVFALAMLRMCVDTVLEEAKPGVVLMFTFEFSLLTLTSVSILLRYLLNSRERKILQMMKKREIAFLQARDLANRERDAAERNVSLDSIPVQEIDEDDLDVAWEQKTKWLFVIDAGTEAVRMAVYIVFFTIMTKFHGLPLHILRNMALTITRLLKKVRGYLRFCQATRDMNSRYPDPTDEELQRSNICIICRDEMQAWNPGSNTEGAGARSERLRPKKLPCGHIIHMTCLRSWLERQTVCPTCRQSTIVNTPNERGGENQPANPRRLFRQFGFGPFRLMVGNVDQNDVQELLNDIRREETRRRNRAEPQRQQQHQAPLQPNQPGPAQAAHIPMDAANAQSLNARVTALVRHIFASRHTGVADPDLLSSNAARLRSRINPTASGSRFGRNAESLRGVNRSSILQDSLRGTTFMSLDDRDDFLAFLERDIRENISHLYIQQQQLQAIRELHEQAREAAAEAAGEAGPSAPVGEVPEPPRRTVEPGISVPAGWTVVPLHSTDYTVPSGLGNDPQHSSEAPGARSDRPRHKQRASPPPSSRETGGQGLFPSSATPDWSGSILPPLQSSSAGSSRPRQTTTEAGSSLGQNAPPLRPYDFRQPGEASAPPPPPVNPHSTEVGVEAPANADPARFDSVDHSGEVELPAPTEPLHTEPRPAEPELNNESVHQRRLFTTSVDDDVD